MSREAYLAEAHRQLMDQNYYCQLDQDLTTYHAEQITSLVRTMVTDRHISKETGKYLTPTNPRAARFYHLSKIHKPSHPGRPIVSSCGAPTERISEYVDHHLRPLVVQIPSYIKDTKDFLLKISNLGPLPPGSILLTLDISSLYTNIPHRDGIEACELALEQWTTQAPPTASLVRMIEQILTMNNFEFNGEYYLQIQGTAMGTRMAPSYANIFMGKLETQLLQYTTDRPSTWWRYWHQ